jgi:hypothetical protein
MSFPMRLITGFIFGTLFVFSTSIMSCRSTPLQAEWHDQAMDLNGKPDWSEFKGLRIQDVQARFVVANDAAQMLFAVQTSDEALMRQIEMGGVTLWLTNPRNKQESFGVRYPARPHDGRREMGPPAEGISRDQMMTRPAASVEFLAKKSAGRTLSEAEATSAGVIAESTQEVATAAYTLALQFRDVAPWLGAGSEVELRVEVPELKMRRPESGEQARPQGRPPMGDEDFGGMGGGMGGGMRGGPRGGPPAGEMNHRSTGKAIRITQRVILATAN